VHAVFRPTEDLAGYIMLLRHSAISYGLPEGKTLQILPEELVLAGLKIHVHSTPEGEVFLYNEKRRLQYRLVQARPPKEVLQPRQMQPTPDKSRRTSSARQRV